MTTPSWCVDCDPATRKRSPSWSGATQREVFTLRDVEGMGSGDVCEVLDLTEGNQRVLLHRARSRLRSMLDHPVPGVAGRHLRPVCIGARL